MGDLCCTSRQTERFRGAVIPSRPFLTLQYNQLSYNTSAPFKTLKKCLKVDFTFAEVPTLNHEVFHHPMERGAFVTQLLPCCFADSFFTCERVKQEQSAGTSWIPGQKLNSEQASTRFQHVPLLKKWHWATPSVWHLQQPMTVPGQPSTPTCPAPTLTTWVWNVAPNRLPFLNGPTGQNKTVDTRTIPGWTEWE